MKTKKKMATAPGAVDPDRVALAAHAELMRLADGAKALDAFCKVEAAALSYADAWERKRDDEHGQAATVNYRDARTRLMLAVVGVNQARAAILADVVPNQAEDWHR